MRTWRVSILLLLAATATGAPEVLAQPDCPRSIPELYERVRNLVGQRREELFERKEKRRKT